MPIRRRSKIWVLKRLTSNVIYDLGSRTSWNYPRFLLPMMGCPGRLIWVLVCSWSVIMCPNIFVLNFIIVWRAWPHTGPINLDNPCLRSSWVSKQVRDRNMVMDTQLYLTNVKHEQKQIRSCVQLQLSHNVHVQDSQPLDCWMILKADSKHVWVSTKS